MIDLCFEHLGLYDLPHSFSIVSLRLFIVEFNDAYVSKLGFQGNVRKKRKRLSEDRTGKMQQKSREGCSKTLLGRVWFGIGGRGCSPQTSHPLVDVFFSCFSFILFLFYLVSLLFFGFSFVVWFLFCLVLFFSVSLLFRVFLLVVLFCWFSFVCFVSCFILFVLLFGVSCFLLVCFLSLSGFILWLSPPSKHHFGDLFCFGVCGRGVDHEPSEAGCSRNKHNKKREWVGWCDSIRAPHRPKHSKTQTEKKTCKSQNRWRANLPRPKQDQIQQGNPCNQNHRQIKDPTFELMICQPFEEGGLLADHKLSVPL